jgi:HSP20 family molecular chaperone IbpA
MFFDNDWPGLLPSRAGVTCWPLYAYEEWMRRRIGEPWGWDADLPIEWSSPFDDAAAKVRRLQRTAAFLWRIGIDPYRDAGFVVEPAPRRYVDRVSRPSFPDQSGMLEEIVETDTDLRVVMEIPATHKEEIDVTTNKNLLTISTEDGMFCKTIQLPKSIVPDGSKATFRNGILEIVLPKDNQTRRTRGLKIN